MTDFIPPGTRVIMPDGRPAVVVRYIDWSEWQKDQRAICRYLDSPLEPAASLPVRMLKRVQEG